MTSVTRHDGESGQAAVELALVVSVLSLILFATVQFGQAFIDMHLLSNAADEGARTASTSAYSVTRASDVRTAARGAAKIGALGTALDTSQITVATCSSSTSCTPSTADVSIWTPGQFVTVQVSYPETIQVLGISFLSGSITRTRTMRVTP